MKNPFTFIYLVATLAAAAPGIGHAAAGHNAMENRWRASILNIESTRMVYESVQPWAKQPRLFFKTGIVIAPREILTAAEDLQDRTLVRVQKFGRGKYYEAHVEWLDYHANLAILGVKDESFWKDLKPVDLVSGPPGKTDLRIARWRNGNLEVRPVDFSQFFVDDARLSTVAALYLEFDSEMTGIGGSSPLFDGPKLAGITCQQLDNHVRAIPASVIKDILEARKKGAFRGLAYFPFFWQPTENTATHQFLKLPGEPRGVVVIYVPALPALAENLQPRDIILQIDGFDIDVQGRYQDPDYGQLLLENLCVRKKYAGDIVRIKVWRDAREQWINFKLPKFEYAARLLPDFTFDQEPEFLMAGGLIFQPLDKAFLRSWGADWKRSAPFRLTYFDNEFPTAERASLVILSMVLPDAYNLGYQDLRALAVEKINGLPVRTVAEAKEAFKKPANGFHIIEFVRSDTVRRVVLDADEMEAANRRILDRYRLPKTENLNRRN